MKIYVSWVIIQKILEISFLWNQFLYAEQVFHPALILKKQPGRSYYSEEAYISFAGCEGNKKSLIDELPTMRNQLFELKHYIEALTKDYIQFKAFVEKGGCMLC